MPVEGKQITVVGAGLMGAAIAVLCAAHRYRVVLCDANPAILESFAERARPIAASLEPSAEGQQEILARIGLSRSVEEGVRGSFMVQEAIHEDLAAKQALFQTLDRICPPDVILATNTSSFLLSAICEGIAGRSRVIGIHYVAPAQLIRAVEIITADFVDPALLPKAREFLKTIDHVGIVCRERPGFLINRLQYALKAEVFRALEENAASIEDIDAAVRLSLGPRLALWGPMLQEDMSTNQRTVVSVSDYLHGSTGEVQFATSPLLKKLADKGETGAAAGAGWYRWTGSYQDTVRERDRQLADLLDWLRKNERIAELGAKPREDHGT